MFRVKNLEAEFECSKIEFENEQRRFKEDREAYLKGKFFVFNQNMIKYNLLNWVILIIFQESETQKASIRDLNQVITVLQNGN